MGVLYCLMSMGINFIYGIMKVINWSMGEFFMIGAYVQYLLLTYILGSEALVCRHCHRGFYCFHFGSRGPTDADQADVRRYY